MNNKKFECALGFHEYTIPDKKSYHVLICEHCKRFGYWKSSIGHEGWFEYDNKGNIIHFKNNNRYEYWYKYDDKGNEIYYKDNEGYECWRHNKLWVKIKPKNWEYENIIKEKING